MANQPLAGVRVVDFGHQIAGPMTALLLADQGADVVSVVRPGRQSIDHPVAEILGRGKSRIELDLHNETDRARARELVTSAHVVIENFRPGVMDAWHLGYDDVRALNAAVVYVSLPGYAATDPRAKLPAWEGPLLAESGLLTDLSLWGAAFSLPPVFTALPLPSVYAALHGAIGAVSALIGRARDGHGAHVTATLLDGAMSAAAGPLLRTVGQPKRYNAPALPTRVVDGLNLRRVPTGAAAALSRKLNDQMPAFFRTFRCGDGRDLFVVVVDNQNHIDKLLKAMGLDTFAADAGLKRGHALDAPPLRNNMYAYRSTTPGLKKLLNRLKRDFLSKSAAEWEQLLGDAGVPVAVQRTTNEWRGLGAALDSGLTMTHRSADGATFGAPGLIADVYGSNVATAPLGVDAAQPLFDRWCSDKEPVFADAAEGVVPEGPLAGMRILDLANVIAGPVVSRTLAELGADVVHIDPVHPKMGPRMLLWMGQEVNQGKRSAAIDLKSDAGAILNELIRSTDGVIYNKLPEQAQRLGATSDDIHALNPGAVVTAVTAWGGPNGGGWEHRPAYDPAIQAGTGIMTRFGGLATPSVHGVAACIDYATGFAGAFGTLVALWARSQGATNLTSRTSLARIAGWVQLPFMTGRTVTEPTGLQSGGWSDTDRLMRTKNGWVYLSIPETSWPTDRAALARALTMDLAPESGQARTQIERELRKLSSAEAVRRLRAEGLSVGEVKDVGRLRADARPTPEHDLVIHEHRSGETLLADQGEGRDPVYIPNPTWLRWNDRPRHRLGSSPLPGAHSEQLLQELSLDASADRWIADGNVVRSWDLPTGPLPE